MTKQTNQFIWVMRIFSGIYFLGALAFFFKSQEVFYLINVGPRVFGISEEMPYPAEHFWAVLATSMMMMLSLISFYSSQSPKEKRYIFIHLLSKATSITGFTYCFFHLHSYFGYMLGALVDSCVFAIVGIAFVRNNSSEGESSAS